MAQEEPKLIALYQGRLTTLETLQEILDCSRPTLFRNLKKMGCLIRIGDKAYLVDLKRLVDYGTDTEKGVSHK